MYEPRYIDLFDYLLFDLQGTLMFGGDRLEETTAFARTYRMLGGTRMSDEEVGMIFHDLLPTMWRLFNDPAAIESFPRLSDLLRDHPFGGLLDDDERALLDAVLAVQELGTIDHEMGDTLRTLAVSHRLGLVSDLWGSSDVARDYLAATGLAGLFTTMVFSSDHRAVKPSPILLRQAHADFGNPPPYQVLCIGDSYERDIAPARAMGFATALIDPARPPEPDFGDRVVASLEELRQIRQ